MLHHVKIAMGGTRVLKYSCFWREKLTPVGGTRVSKYVFWRDIHSHIYTDMQYMRACNQLVVHIVSQTTE